MSLVVISDGKVVESSSMPDVIPPAQVYPMIEEYYYHLGFTDDFFEVAVAGNGTSTLDVTDTGIRHLLSGAALAGSAVVRTKKLFQLLAKPLVINMMILSANTGLGAERLTYAGLHDSFTHTGGDDAYSAAMFILKNDNKWYTRTHKTGVAGTTDTLISTDPYYLDATVLTIVATATKVNFYVDGGLVSSHTTNLPAAALKIGASCIATAGTVSASRDFDIDMINYRKYV